MFVFESGKKIFSTEAHTAKIPFRDEIEEKYKWNLKDIYDSDDDWESELKLVENNLSNYKTFEGRLGESAEILLECLNLDKDIGSRLEKLYLYAMLSKDSDMSNTKYQAYDDRIKAVYSKAMTASAFIKPELLQLDEKKLLGMIDSLSELKIYKHFIDDLLRFKAHTLTKREEELLAMAGEISQVAYNTYSIFTNADLKFPTIKDNNGNEIEISHARYYSALYSKDRVYRENAFKGYLSSYKNHSNTLATLYNGNLKTNIFFSKARGYKSAKEAALHKNNIPISVYDNLISAVNNNFAPMHRWAALKKKLLQIDELHPYDIYVTLFNQNLEKKYSYEEAKGIVLNSLNVMGKEYQDSILKAFNNRWIDVYETRSKRSGAYSSGTTYGVHPYVLLNWTDLLNDIFTLAHEMGHNMHSHFTGLNQPYIYANYSIFLAEVASTFNENLLLDYLIENSQSADEKLFLIEKYLNNITTTVFRQVMFSEFESITYDKIENGNALTTDDLCKIYGDLFQKYWGPEMVVDEEETFTWSRVPHFYYNFYVYQYATGFAASEALAGKVKSEGQVAVKKYLEFLKAGSSDYPINILKYAGVDMNSVTPILAVTKKMNQLLDEIEKIL